MAADLFYQTAGQQSGPVDSRELRRLAEAGIVRPDTLVRQGASGRWVHAEHVRGLFQRSTPATRSSVSSVVRQAARRETNEPSEKFDTLGGPRDPPNFTKTLRGRIATGRGYPCPRCLGFQH